MEAAVNAYVGSKDNRRNQAVSAALNPLAAEPYLKKCLTQYYGKNIWAELRSIRVVGDTPEGYAVEYDMWVRTSATTAEDITLVGRSKGQRLETLHFLLLKSLWKAGFDDQSADRVCVPEPVGIIPELQMWFHRKHAGVPCLRVSLLVCRRLPS